MDELMSTCESPLCPGDKTGSQAEIVRLRCCYIAIHEYCPCACEVQECPTCKHKFKRQYS